MSDASSSYAEFSSLHGFGDEFLRIVRTINPHAAFSGNLTKFIQDDIQKTLVDAGVPRDLILKVLTFAVCQPHWRDGFLTEKPQWYLVKNWNKMSDAYHKLNHAPSEEKKEVYRNMCGVDVDQLLKNSLTQERAKQIAPHARQMMLMGGGRAHLYAAVVACSEGREYLSLALSKEV